MLGSNGKGKKVMAHDNVLNTISHGTVIKGEIHTAGDIRIEGHVMGNIQCDAKLVIGERGPVEGTVNARNAIVSGKVQGTVYVHELLQLESKARVEGDIYTQKLSVAIGADFTGNCRMGEEAKSAEKEIFQNSESLVREKGGENGKRRSITKSILTPGGRKSEKGGVNEQEAAKTAV